MDGVKGEKLHEVELTDRQQYASENGPEDSDHVMNKDTEKILNDSNAGVQSSKWKLEGMNIVILSVVVLSTALTFALILNVIFGNPQVLPHGSVAVENDFCGSVGLRVLEKEKGNAVDSVVSTILCLTVTRPDVASLAGCGAILVRDRNKQISYLFDFLCSAPNDYPSTRFPVSDNPATLTGLPGLVKGLYTVHRQFGQNKWSDLFTGALEAATNGFLPDNNVAEAAKLFAGNKSPDFQAMLNNLLNHSSRYYPSSELISTLKNLADWGPKYFYSNFSNPPNDKSFTERFIGFLNGQNMNWSMSELQQYSVRIPTSLKMGFAGFTLETFPSPLVGGPFLLLLLGNLDLKDSVSPLDHKALSSGDPKVTAIYLNRLIELSRLAESSISSLGDINDDRIKNDATKAQNALFSAAAREATVNSVQDTNVVSNYSSSSSTLIDSSIGSTGIVVTDSTSLTVVANIFLGSPFGNGQIVPRTGVHLNSALNMFSKSVGSNDKNLNVPAPNRRPLVPLAPVYMSTTHRKCGIRIGITSAPGLWGLVDMAQVISNAALFLRNATCTSHAHSSNPAVLPNAPTDNGKSSDSYASASRAVYTPATDRSCINPNVAIGLKRFNPRPVSNSTAKGSQSPILVEPSFESELLVYLSSFGHSISQTSALKWPGRVFLAGWNGYDMVSSGDGRSLPQAKSIYIF